MTTTAPAPTRRNRSCSGSRSGRPCSPLMPSSGATGPTRSTRSNAGGWWRRAPSSPSTPSCGPKASSAGRTQAMSPGWRTGPSSVARSLKTPARRTTGSIPRRCAPRCSTCIGERCEGGPLCRPFSMGPLGSPIAHIGVQLTDSAYVAASMHIMTRMGSAALDVLGESGEFVRCLHSVGHPLAPGQADVPWPCDPERKYIVHFPETREICSYGSGYGGNALLGKKCFALRIASTMARDQGWLAEHMLILDSTNRRRDGSWRGLPERLWQDQPGHGGADDPRMESETIGDDICWMKFERRASSGPSIRSAACSASRPVRDPHQPHRCPGPGRRHDLHQRGAYRRRGLWWEGWTPEPPDHLTRLVGARLDPDECDPRLHIPTAASPLALPGSRPWRPNGRTRTGVPISAICSAGVGNRRPLVTESFDWAHGVFLGSTWRVRQRRRRPVPPGAFAAIPLPCCRSAGTTWPTTSATGCRSDWSAPLSGVLLPKLFYVNWFRKDSDGRFIWPGYGDNARVLAWIFARCEGTCEAPDTPIGFLPTQNDLNLDGLEIDPTALAELIVGDPSAWRNEVPLIEEHFAQFADRLPGELRRQLTTLEERLG